MVQQGACAFLLLVTSVTSATVLTAESLKSNTTAFDYVILGGGTAGLVVANRLSANPNVTVAVIEAGTFQQNNTNVTTIERLGAARLTEVDWQYETVPQLYGDNHTILYSAGKGVGGSSLINGMTYMRPTSSQIDLWPSLGLEIDWNTLFTWSKKGERFTVPGPNLTEYGAAYVATDHGYGGPLTTCISPLIPQGTLHDTFNSTFQALGIAPRPDFDGGALDGFGIQAAEQNSTAQIREDAARAYYYPVEDRPNLFIMVNTTATHLVWASKSSNGTSVASAAQVETLDGQILTVKAKREIILSAGSMRTPGILERSGVGNAAILKQQSIETVIDNPAVGENLQDQTVIYMTASLINQNITGFPPFVAHATLHDLFGSNTSAVYNSTLAKLPQYGRAIAGENGGASSASTQEHLLSTQLDLLNNSNTPTAEIAPIAIGNELLVVFWPLQPFSRGNVHINSTNQTAPPRIDPRFFQVDFDGTAAVATSKFVRNFLTTAPLSSIVNRTSIVPSFETIPEDANDDAWLAWIKNSSYSPNYHYLGTAAMLPRASGGVVDNDFIVYGTKNVRVVDLSVVPLQIAGHSTAPLYGIAEYAAHKIVLGQGQ